MAYTLRLTFGGLCLLVEEAKGGAGAGRGFYVVMPIHKTMEHIPTLLYRERYGYAGTGDAWVVQPIERGQAIDLRSCAPAGVGGGPMPKRFARMSRYAGAAVDATCLKAAGGNVDIVVQLPLLQRPVEPYGDLACIHVKSKAGEDCDDWVAGLARVEYDVPDDRALVIDGVWLTARNGLLDVVLANVPTNASTPGTPVHKPSVGDPVQHARAYYDVLSDASSGGGSANGPMMCVKVSSPDCPWLAIGAPPAPAGPLGALNNLHNQWIIPEECTVGIGCPPSTPNC